MQITLKRRGFIAQAPQTAGLTPGRVAARTSAVAVLGAGHGGMALAGYLANEGHRVALWNRSPGRTAAVSALGRIRLTLPDATVALAPIALAASDIAAVLGEAERVLVTVPACAHADVARECAPYLRDGQSVLLLPGRTGGALEFRRALHDAGCRAQILLGEANTFPLAARSVAPASAIVYGTKAEILAAALPATRTSELLRLWRPLLPMLSRARSVLHTGFANFGAILHPIITLLNAERIRRAETFDFYSDGVTEEVANVLAAADAERLSVARAFGVPACSLRHWIASAYGHRAASMRQAVAGNPAYVGIKAPATLDHRYLYEDVPTGLVPLIELGAAAGLNLPTLRRLVVLARTVGEASWQRERTLAGLGLGGLGLDQIRQAVEGDAAAKAIENSAFGSSNFFPTVFGLKGRFCQPRPTGLGGRALTIAAQKGPYIPRLEG